MVRAIWDTGATNSVINQKVVDACGLVATGAAQCQGVHGNSIVDTYFVNIMLPNGIGHAMIRVSKGDLGTADMLIGMDLITLGDFAVTNKDGQTMFSFRYPSQLHTDYKAQDALKNSASFNHGGNKNKRKKHGKNFGKNK